MKHDTGFSYLNKTLHCEGVPVKEIANDVGTPAYIYSKTAIINRVRRLQTTLQECDIDCDIYFAVKACSNIHILTLLSKLGCGADIVSAGELFRSTIAQVSPSKIVFSGVGKTEKEIAEAIKAKIFAFNVESAAELYLIDKIAKELNEIVSISLRVNPDVDAKTHPHISTGLKKNKFGLAKSELKDIYRHLNSFSNLKFMGLSCHIGSQILSATPFVKAWKQLLEFAEQAPFEVTHLNLGGGLGISYNAEGSKNKRQNILSLEEYGMLISKVFKGKKFKLGIEPGRALVGPAAILLTRLIRVKKRPKRSFYIVDAAMNDLVRPALYGAIHPVVSVSSPLGRKTCVADLVGPVCESADTFQTGAKLPELNPGDFLAFGNAGAYGMTMASQYNSRPKPIEILVEGSTYKIIRTRETYADLIAREL